MLVRTVQIRRRSLAVLLTLGTVFSGCLGETTSKAVLPTPPAGGPLRYVALGDSYPAGAGSPDNTSYVDHYERLIEGRSETEVEVSDLSTSGATTTDLLTTMQNREALTALAQAQLVTLTIGGNDFLQAASTCRDDGCFGSTLTEIERRLDQVAERVRSAAPGALVLMTNYPDVVAGNPVALSALGYGSFEVARDVSARSADLVCGVAHRHGMTCVDVYRAFNGPEGKDSAAQAGLLAQDIIHPSDQGHRVIAQLMCDIACS